MMRTIARALRTNIERMKHKDLGISHDPEETSSGLVYKFRRAAGIENLLENQSICFSRAADFNDCFEAMDDFGNEVFELAKFGLCTLPGLNNPHLNDHQREQMINEYLLTSQGAMIRVLSNQIPVEARKELLRRIAIFCLSKDIRNPVMWGLYAQEHRGFAVGFSPDSQVFTESTIPELDLTGLVDVTYISERSRSDSTDLRLNISKILTRKLHYWSFESEVRAFRKLPANSPELNIQVPFCDEDIKEIIIGHRMTADHRNKLFQLCKTKYPSAKILVSLPSPSSTKMILDSAEINWQIIDEAQHELTIHLLESDPFRKFKDLGLH